LELTQEATQFLERLKKGDDSKETPGNTKTGEKYKGEVAQQIIEKIRTTRMKVAAEKEKMILDKTVYKVSDSFEIPSGYIIEGTYFDQRLKEKANELEAFHLRNGDLPIIKALREIIEVVNLLFNTPSEPFFFVWHLKDLIALVKDQQVEVQNSGVNDELATEMLIFMMRLTHIFEDVLNWKETKKMRNGDVKNLETEVLLKSVETDIPRYEEYMINVTRLSVYMTAREYEKETIAHNEEMEKLSNVRLAANNVECVERYDDLVAKLEGIMVGLKQIYEAKNKNYQVLKNIYEDHKHKIDKGVYDIKTRADHAKEFEALVEDFDKRFGNDIAYGTRKNVLYWIKEIKLLQLGPHGKKP